MSTPPADSCAQAQADVLSSITTADLLASRGSGADFYSEQLAAAAIAVEAIRAEPCASTAPFVTVHATHPSSSRTTELRIDTSTLVKELKLDLEDRFGTPPPRTKLVLSDESGSLVAELTDEGATLSSFGPRDHWAIRWAD